MKVLLIGSNGQLGWELQRTCPAGFTLMSCDFPKIDLCSTGSIQGCIEKIHPECIINAAAYTAVDRAEVETDLAYRVNYEAVEEIAKLAEKQKAHLVHISTDFIFSGENFKPYLPEDTPCPESVYGTSKLKGEQAVAKILKEKAFIVLDALTYAGNRLNLVAADKFKNFKFVHGNILNQDLVERLLKEENITTIVHFAAEYHVDRAGHDRRYAINAEKITSDLGYRPVENFETGIAKTLDWYLKNESWWRKIMDKSYLDWVECNYKGW